MYWGYLLVMCHLPLFFYSFVFTNCIYIEDITRPRGDTKFLFEGWKIFHSFVALTREIFFSTWEEKFPISKRPCNILFIIQTPMKYQTILLKRFFGLKGAVYYEAIAMVIFSHVKISFIFKCEDTKFSRESSLGISLVIIKMFSPSFLTI